MRPSQRRGHCEAGEEERLALVDLKTRRAGRENGPSFGYAQHLGRDLVAAHSQSEMDGVELVIDYLVTPDGPLDLRFVGGVGGHHDGVVCWLSIFVF